MDPDVARTVVLDCGSSEIRAGWAACTDPIVRLTPFVVRQSDRTVGRGKLGAAAISARSVRPRTPFDNGVLVNPDLMEVVLDNAFASLYGASRSAHQAPDAAVATEPICTPSLSRAILAELLHETYAVDRVAFGVDALFALHQNRVAMKLAAPFTGTVLSLSASASTVLPIEADVPQFARATRVPVGSAALGEFMRRLLLIKHNEFPRILPHAEYSRLVQEHCYFARDYAQEISARLRGGDVVLQYPVLPRAAPAPTEQIRLPPEEQEAYNADRTAWIMELVREYQQTLRAKNTGEATTEQRRKFETQNKMRNMTALIDESELLRDGSLQDKNGRKKRRVTKGRRTAAAGLEIDDDTFAAVNNAERQLDIDEHEMQVRAARDVIIEDAAAARELRVERLLAEHDPYGYYQRRSFPLLARLANGPDESTKATVSTAVAGAGSKIGSNAEKDAAIACVANQLRLNIELIRVPELLFQPPMMAVDSRGIGEALAGESNVFCTGGAAALRGLAERLCRDLAPDAPSGTPIRVHVASDPVLDAWRGAALAVRDGGPVLTWSTRQQFAEHGENFFLRHKLSNLF